jgi:hypothetical protein
MIKGITPIDAAFEVMGLVQAENLMRFLFVETLIGKAVFGVGFVLSLKSAMDAGSLRAVLIFALMFFSVWFLVVIPKIRIGNVTCAMEQNGTSAGTTQEILKNNGYGEGKTILVLDVFSNALTGLAKGMVVVMERLHTGATTYLTEPMARSMLVIKTRKALEAGIVDEQLRERAVWFCQDHFGPAVRKIEEKGTTALEGLWPGSREVMAVYTNEGTEEWGALSKELFLMLDQKGQLFSKVFEYFEGYDDKDAAQVLVLKELFRQEFLRRADQYAIKSWRTKKSNAFSQGPAVVNVDGGEKKSEWVLENSAHVQGLLLFYGYSIFPIVLGASVLLRNAGVLGVYVLLLVLVRGMTVMWAFMDQAAKMLFDMAGKNGAVLPWEMGQVNECVAWAMVVFPVVTGVAMGIGVMRKKKGQQEVER